MKLPKVSIKWPNGINTTSKSGENWLKASKEAGVDIPTGCLTGSCGACEIEVNGTTYRACIHSVPDKIPGELKVEFAKDPYW